MKSQILSKVQRYKSWRDRERNLFLAGNILKQSLCDVELQTKVREDFIMTEKNSAPASQFHVYLPCF